MNWFGYVFIGGFLAIFYIIPAIMKRYFKEKHTYLYKTDIKYKSDYDQSRKEDEERKKKREKEAEQRRIDSGIDDDLPF